MKDQIFIRNLAFAGFRSFGPDLSYFDEFAKINLFIGRNNAGKSNVLRLLKNIYPHSEVPAAITVDPLNFHLPSRPAMRISVGTYMSVNENGQLSIDPDYPLLRQSRPENKTAVHRYLTRVFAEKRRLEGTELCWNTICPPNRTADSAAWKDALRVLNDHELQHLWISVSNYTSGGSRQNDWEPEIIRKLQPSFSNISVALIPAIRQIGAKGTVSDDFDGLGIIDRLAKLQNPGPHDQADRDRFYKIRDFLRIVVDDPLAEIEVPYERDTLIVHMDGRPLPIESLGSGIHEVIILAAAATILTDQVICIEEPELHLNPILQKKLMRYLSLNTSNQYFITTHSAALMDTPKAEVYHITLQNTVSLVHRVTSDSKRSLVCEDLGYHPSDLLQANCVIWVEGPSDRIYINFWIKGRNADLIEGVHYIVMFYGGKLSSHLTYNDDLHAIEEFISLRRLNRRGVIVLDSDKSSSRSPINATKQRLIAEFNTGPGHAWLTEGREVENYLPIDQVRTAIGIVAPRSTPVTGFGKFENILTIKTKANPPRQAPKVDVARHITTHECPDYTPNNLHKEIARLIEFILQSNPSHVP